MTLKWLLHTLGKWALQCDKFNHTDMPVKVLAVSSDGYRLTESSGFVSKRSVVYLEDFFHKVETRNKLIVCPLKVYIKVDAFFSLVVLKMCDEVSFICQLCALKLAGSNFLEILPFNLDIFILYPDNKELIVFHVFILEHKSGLGISPFTPKLEILVISNRFKLLLG